MITFELCAMTTFIMFLRRSLRRWRYFANKRQRYVTGHHFPEGEWAFGRWIHEGNTAPVRWLPLAPGSIIEARQGLACVEFYDIFSMRKKWMFRIFSKLVRIFLSLHEYLSGYKKNCQLPKSFFQIPSLLLRPTKLEWFCDTNLTRPSVRSSLITCARDAFRLRQKLCACV